MHDCNEVMLVWGSPHECNEVPLMWGSPHECNEVSSSLVWGSSHEYNEVTLVWGLPHECNEVTFTWGSLRLAPIKIQCKSDLAAYLSSLLLVPISPSDIFATPN